MTPGFTHVGILGSDARARVDAGGRVALPTGWMLDWWVGAEDRWHLPEHETAVRQTLVGAAPVVETAMRVPGGDAVQRVYAVPRADGGGALVVMEVENRSAVPFAVAFVRRGAAVADDGVSFARPPARHATADGLRLDVVPLPHTATIQAVVAVEGRAPDGFPPAVPSANSVAKGWEAQAGRGMRTELPDASWSHPFAAARSQLLLAELGDGRLVDEEAGRRWAVAGTVLRALDRLGLHPEAERVLLRLANDEPPDEPGAALIALDHHVRLTDDRALARGLVEVVAELARILHGQRFRRGRRVRSDVPASPTQVVAFAAVERLLLAAGEPRAAADARADADAVRAVVGHPAPAATPPVPPGPRPGLAAAAGFVEDVLASLLRFDDDAVVLAPSVPEAWLGRGWEVHDSPTPAGRLSYAVRWHGERPALLWHLEPHDAAAAGVVLRAPGLDASWSSRELRGEALLVGLGPRAAGSFS